MARVKLPTVKNYKVEIFGLVQSIGFRPFIYRLAHRLKLSGWIENNGKGVLIFLSGLEKNQLDFFLATLQKEKMPQAEIQQIEVCALSDDDELSKEFVKSQTFEESFFIKSTANSKVKTARILPDLIMCSDCLKELFDPCNRRYLYPFINCTHCGPRFSIIEDLPYDRKNTSMRKFKMCAQCEGEYADPLNRRFHAEPISCVDCGPQIQLYMTTKSNDLDTGVAAQIEVLDPLTEVARLLASGNIIALKGVGGFQLLADASNADVIERLRYRKKRESKPFAVMFASLQQLKECCEVSATESKILTSVSAPIVLLKKKPSVATEIANSVAPANPYLGAFLASSPLHFLLLRLLGRPLVVTSGNLSDEPICIDNNEAFVRLRPVADYFLIHNRDIVRPLDDSIVQCVSEHTMVLRMGRGYCPSYRSIESTNKKQIMALGSQIKNTLAFYQDQQIYLSQHFGDLDQEISQNHYERELKKCLQFFNCDTEKVQFVTDNHPDYFSSFWAQKNTKKTIRPIQHHYAHLYSAVFDCKPKEDFLGIVWDGTGLGLDHSIWGGEFFRGIKGSSGFTEVQRMGSLRPFPLLGGESGIRNPWKILLGLFYELNLTEEFCHVDAKKAQIPTADIENLLQLQKQKNFYPMTSSVGRFFDAIASLLFFNGEVEYEAQAAMALEFEATKNDDRNQSDEDYFKVTWLAKEGFYILDWQNIFEKIFTDKKKGVNSSRLALMFHFWLSKAIFDLAQILNVNCIVLSGGVFQNRLLLEEIFKLSEKLNIMVHISSQTPVNDGGVALGQLVSVLTGLEV